MGLVTLEDGERVNTAGGVAHFLGFGWVGRYLEPVDSIDPRPHEVGFLSGACLAVRRRTWYEVGGFPELFFVYVEDLDISHRLRLAGRRFGVLPDARLRHGYEFGGRAWKLMEIEKNRWLMIVRCYPAPLLWLVMPALLALEPVMLAYAASQGWGRAKLQAIAGFVRGLPQALRERGDVQRLAAVSPGAFAAGLQAELDSPLFGGIGRSRFVRLVLRLYWAAVRAALGRA
jgi:GT2 family glycosyltransferase